MSDQQKQAISGVILAYATVIDSRDWSLARPCFSEDVMADQATLAAGHRSLPPFSL